MFWKKILNLPAPARKFAAGFDFLFEITELC